MKTVNLAVSVLGNPPSTKQYLIWRVALGRHPKLAIDQDVYESLSRVRRHFSEVSSLEEKFFAITEGYREIEMLIHRATLDTCLGRVIDTPGYFGVGAEFGRLTSAFLSAVRLYQDTLASHAKAIMDSPAAGDSVKSILSNAYDTYFPYRFMDAVRNHAQHQAFPVHRSRYGGKWSEGHEVLTFETEFHFLAEKVGDKKFKSSVLDEIRGLGGSVDLKSSVRDYFAIVADIHVSVREMLSATVEQDERTMAFWRKRWADETGDTNLTGVAAVCFQGDLLDKSVKQVHLSPQLDEYRQKLVQQTSQLSNMWARKLRM
ncbi:hypothetical protein GOB10_10755 [Sinorhizobium meliloti]|nr:hypothetical protein [Sinorhizobium meliloti]